MWREYRDRVEFFVVYIKEAHPEDGWISQGNVDADIHVWDPETNDERTEVAQTCALRLDIEMPMLLDGIENRVASVYGALPDRLYLIGRAGRVAYQGEKGPFGFKFEELLAAIEAELAGSSVA